MLRTLNWLLRESDAETESQKLTRAVYFTTSHPPHPTVTRSVRRDEGLDGDAEVLLEPSGGEVGDKHVIHFDRVVVHDHEQHGLGAEAGVGCGDVHTVGLLVRIGSKAPLVTRCVVGRSVNITTQNDEIKPGGFYKQNITNSATRKQS
jgi:hypothetical protein